MGNSHRHSYLVLRLGLAFVFLWFGIDKFFHPNFWITAWIPGWVMSVVSSVGIGALQFVYLQGVFEVLVGLGMLTNVFTRFFSICATVFLVCVLLFAGHSDITVRDVGLLGAALSILLWPEERKR